MRIPTLKPMPDLNPVPKRIITIDCMPALLVPRNLSGIRSPVKLAPIEFFEDRRVKLPSDAKVNVRAPYRARTARPPLVVLMPNEHPHRTWHRERKLLVCGHLFLLPQAGA